MSTITAERIEPGLLTTNLGTLSAIVDVDRSWSDTEILAAVRGLLNVFPVLDCIYVPGWWRDTWQTDPAPIKSIVTIIDSQAFDIDTERAILAHIEPLTSRPIRVTFLRASQKMRIILNMPHLVSDGNGVLTCLQELAAQLMGTGRTGEFVMDRSVDQLRTIIRFGNILGVFGAMLGEARRIMMVPFMKRWVGRFTSASTERSITRVRLTEAQSTAVAAFSKAHGGTVNDGLVAASVNVVSHYAESGLIGTAYTINLRRFLHHKNPIVANLSGFDTVAGTGAKRDLGSRIADVAKITQKQKNALPGVGSLLAPMMLFGWMPHGAMHWVGSRIKTFMAWQASRMALMTNVGVMDPYISPFGNLATDAWMAGPFVPRFPSPLAMATSFRGRLSVSVASVEGAAPEGAREFATHWQNCLNELAEKGIPATV